MTQTNLLRAILYALLTIIMLQFEYGWRPEGSTQIGIWIHQAFDILDWMITSVFLGSALYYGVWKDDDE